MLWLSVEGLWGSLLWIVIDFRCLGRVGCAFFFRLDFGVVNGFFLDFFIFMGLWYVVKGCFLGFSEIIDV